MASVFTNSKYPYVSSAGVWQELRTGNLQKNPALFLDRDGVVVKEVNYLQDPDDVELIEGAAEVIARANQANIPVILVTNQAGIAYGYFGWSEFEAVQTKLHNDLNQRGAHIDAVFACPFHQNGDTIWGGYPEHEARKPNPGMLLRATKMLEIDLTKSWIVGDRDTDLEAGKKAGIAGGLHVLTGHGKREGERERANELAAPNFLVENAGSIQEAPKLPLFSG